MSLAERVRLFVYDSWLAGERQHDRLAGATFILRTRTAASYTLVELGPYGALLSEGSTSVAGEVYEIDKKLRFALDIEKQCPALFQRGTVLLEDGTSAEAYFMSDEQTRGKRRIKNGSWRDRFAPRPRPLR